MRLIRTGISARSLGLPQIWFAPSRQEAKMAAQLSPLAFKGGAGGGCAALALVRCGAPRR